MHWVCNMPSYLRKQWPIRHADAAGDGADDADEALVRATDEQVRQVRAAVELLFRGLRRPAPLSWPVKRTIVVGVNMSVSTTRLR